MRVVIDTNVLVSALRSQRGASHRLIQQLGENRYKPVISTPLCLEYEDVLGRPKILSGLAPSDISDFLDYFLSQSVECPIHFLWRPYLSDPKDDLVLEVALAGSAEYIITHNTRHFPSIETLGIRVVTPAQFIAILSML